MKLFKKLKVLSIICSVIGIVLSLYGLLIGLLIVVAIPSILNTIKLISLRKNNK